MAAEAAWCAADQGKFFDYHHQLFEIQPPEDKPITLEMLTEAATTVGLDRDTFSSCLSKHTHQAELEKAGQAAMKRGVKSTPTFYVNNRKISGNVAYEQFQQAIDRELEKAQ